MSVHNVLLFSSCRFYIFLAKVIPGCFVVLLLLRIGSSVSYLPIDCFSCTKMVLIFLCLTYILIPY